MPWMPKSHYALSTFAKLKHWRYEQQHHRNPVIVAFYKSAVWRSLRLIKLGNNPICQHCHTEPAVDVHHVEPLKVSMNRALEYAGLLSVCRSCHKLVEGKPLAAILCGLQVVQAEADPAKMTGKNAEQSPNTPPPPPPSFFLHPMEGSRPVPESRVLPHINPRGVSK